MRPIVADKRVKYYVLRLNRSQEIPPAHFLTYERTPADEPCGNNRQNALRRFA